MKFPKYIEPDFTKEPFVSAPDVKTEKAGKNYLPINFYATTIYPEYFKINGEWKMIKESRMDSVIVIKNGYYKIKSGTGSSTDPWVLSYE